MQSLQFGILVGNLPEEEEKAMFRKSIYLFADLLMGGELVCHVFWAWVIR